MTNITYKEYQKNINQSKEISGNYKELIKQKDCYFNIYRLVTDSDLLSHYNLRVAFGYVFAMNLEGDEDRRLFTAHAFLVNENNEIVDPTLPNENSNSYFVIKEFTDWHEYLSAVLDCKYPSLLNNKEYETEKRKFSDWAYHNQITPID